MTSAGGSFFFVFFMHMSHTRMRTIMRIMNDIAVPKQIKKSCELSVYIEKKIVWNYDNKARGNEMARYAVVHIPFQIKLCNYNLHLLSPFNSISRISEP